MNILYASDENYLRHAAASMVSLCEHTPPEAELRFHLLSMGVSSQGAQRLRDTLAPYGRELCLWELGDLRKWFDFSVNSRGFALSTLARLFVGRVLPEDVHRVLYLDCDTLPLEDLSALAGHGWAWKYPDHTGASSLHLIRGTVRNVPGEDYYLTELRGAVRFNHVDFSYVPGKRILKDVSVYANPGQKIAFVGSTGAGKTTITNLINRFYEIEGGLITYDGLDVKAIRKDDLRRSLGAVLQDTHLFTGTILDNIRYGRLDATDEECIAAAKSANAHSFIRRLPQGYQTMVSGDGGNLSQGQRQLLAIARAAVADPPVMILDEATSSIDTRTEALIQKGMDTLMEGRTVFVIAHRLSTVRNSNCIVVIEHGQIEEKGSHDQLLEKKGRYYHLYTGQFQLS